MPGGGKLKGRITLLLFGSLQQMCQPVACFLMSEQEESLGFPVALSSPATDPWAAELKSHSLLETQSLPEPWPALLDQPAKRRSGTDTLKQQQKGVWIPYRQHLTQQGRCFAMLFQVPAQPKHCGRQQSQMPDTWDGCFLFFIIVKSTSCKIYHVNHFLIVKFSGVNCIHIAEKEIYRTFLCRKYETGPTKSQPLFYFKASATLLSFLLIQLFL